MEDLKYLDDIIVFIKDSHNSEATLDEICEKMTGHLYNSNIPTNKTDGQVTADGVIQINKTFYERQNKVVEALRYLYDEKLLNSVDNSSTYRLTFKGIVKSNFGFVNEYLEKEAERKLQNQLTQDQITEIKKSRRMSWWAIGISLLATAGALWQVYNDYAHNDAKSNQDTTHTEDKILPSVKESSKLQK